MVNCKRNSHDIPGQSWAIANTLASYLLKSRKDEIWAGDINIAV
jgi:hypothetical protein